MILLLFSISALSQESTLELRVLEKNSGEPVDAANVLYEYTIGENRQTGFEMTGSDGMVQLSIMGPVEQISLEIFHLTYEPYQGVIELKEASDQPIEIMLLPRVHEIQEVRIEGEHPYYEPVPDTITFVVDSIATAATPGIVDVLERIDGIEIAGDRITYDGHLISRVFLDGLDLTSDSYMTMVDAIGTSIIEEIDILTNFHSNPVISDFEASEMAIDLRTDGSRSMEVSGSGSAGFSNREMLNLGADAVGILPGIRTMARYTNNRLSYNVYRPSGEFAGINPIAMPLGNVSRRYEIPPEMAPVESTRYTLDQKIQGGTGLMAFRAGRNWTVRSSNYFQESSLPHFHSLSTVNYLPDTVFRYGYENRLLSEQQFFRTELEAERKRSDSYLNIQFNSSLPRQSSTHQRYFSGQISDTLDNSIKLRDAFHLNPKVEFTRRLSNGILDFRHQMEFTHFAEIWENANQRTAVLRDQSGIFTDEILTRQLQSTAELLIRQHWWTDYRATWGLAHKFTDNNKDLDIKSTEFGSSKIEESSSSFRSNNIYGVFQLEKGTERSRINYVTRINLGISSLQWRHDAADTKQKNNPQLDLDFQFTRRFTRWSRLISNYSFYNRPIDSRYFLPRSFLSTNYQFVRSFEGRGVERGHSLGFRFSRQRPDRLFSFNTSLQLGYQPKAVVPAIDYFLTHNVTTYRTSSRKNYRFDFSWERGLINSYWSLRGQFGTSGNRYTRIINNQTVQSDYRHYLNRLSGVYRKGGLSVILTGQVSYQIIKSDLIDQRSERWYWNAEIEVNYLTKNEKIRLGVESKYYHYDNRGSTFTTLGFNLDFFPAPRWQIRFSGHNLLDIRDFNLRRFSPEFDYTQKFQIRPRYVSCSVTYRF